MQQGMGSVSSGNGTRTQLLRIPLWLGIQPRNRALLLINVDILQPRSLATELRHGVHNRRQADPGQDPSHQQVQEPGIVRLQPRHERRVLVDFLKPGFAFDLIALQGSRHGFFPRLPVPVARGYLVDGVCECDRIFHG